MKIFKDVFETEASLSEAKDKRFLATLKFSYAVADKFNKNKHFYPEKILKAADEKLNQRLKSNLIPGQSDHPFLGANTQLANVSHVLLQTYMKDKVAYAEAGILPTTKGKDILQVLKSGVTIGASLRGYGSMDKEGKVQSDLDIRSIDLVISPGFPSATISQKNVYESYIPAEERIIEEEFDDEEKFSEQELREVHQLFNSAGVIPLKPFDSGGREEVKSAIARVRLKKMYDQMIAEGEDLEDFDSWLVRMAGNGTKKQPVIDEELELRKSKLKEANIAGLSHAEYENFLKGKEEKDKLVQPGDGKRFMEAKLAGFAGSFFAWLEWRYK